MAVVTVLLFSFSVLLAVSVPVPQRPSWYSRNRTHAHTRLSISSHCRQSVGAEKSSSAATDALLHTNLNRTSTGVDSTGGVSDWICSAVFEEAAERFASLGVPAFVRHTKTADEGTWWRSGTGPPESWHPLVRATGRNLPKEFLTKAEESGVHVILYHYMKTSAYWSKARPDWVMRWPDGMTPIKWKRGTGMSPCSAEWRSLYIAQVLELVDMGADAFYFDEFPGSPGGDWNRACVALYRARHGADDMPTAIDAAASNAAGYPVSTSREVLRLMTDVTELYFAELVAAIGNFSNREIKLRSSSAGRGGAVALVSTHTVPAADNSGIMYETTSLLSHGPQDVAKSEFITGTRNMCPPRPRSTTLTEGAAAALCGPGDPFPPDILASFGWAMMRDAAYGRPPHIWIPFLATSNQSVCAVAAARTFGVVANPDHAEAGIPDTALFGETYRLSMALDTFDDEGNSIPQDLAPLRHTAVLFSESARNSLEVPVSPAEASGMWAFNITAAWRRVLYPTLSAWEALVREGVAAGLIVDGHLLLPRGGAKALARRWPVVVATAVGALPPAIEAALEAYVGAGGEVVRLRESDAWTTASGRAVLERELIREIGAAGGGGLGPFRRHILAAPVMADAAGLNSTDALHTVVFDSATITDIWLVLITNNFTSCIPSQGWRGPLVLPRPQRKVVLDLAAPEGYAVDTVVQLAPRRRTYKVVRRNGTNAPNDGWRVLLGTVGQFVAVSVRFVREDVTHGTES